LQLEYERSGNWEYSSKWWLRSIRMAVLAVLWREDTWGRNSRRSGLPPATMCICYLAGK